MADRISTFTIAIDGDDGTLKKVLSTVKSDFTAAVRDLESATKKVQLFGDIEKQAKDAKEALNLAQAAVGLFADQVAKAKASGAGISDELAKSLKDATKAAADAERAYARTQMSLTKLSTQLARAGVDTKSLASEQIRLSTALKQATAAQEQQAARQALGVKILADIQPQIDKIRNAYTTLANSGTLTQTQLTAAWIKQKAAIFEASQSVTGFRDILSQVKAPALAAVAALTAIGVAVAATVSKYNAFNDAVLRGSTVTNLSKAQLDNLAAGARDVAKEFGENAQTAVKATFELIRSGIPQDNAITALRDAAIAAQGGLADLGVTAQLGATILQGYGKTADELPKIYDQIAFAAHAGGASIDELGANIGSLLPVARAAHVPFDELLASITILQKAGLDTGQSVQVLKRLIAGFADPAVIAKLAEMGIAVDGLVGTLKQIGEKDFDISKLKDLAPDARSLTGVVALTKGYQNLDGVLGGLRTQADGASLAASKIVDVTAADKVRKLSAAFDSLESSIGHLAANPAIITFITNVANKLDEFATGIAKAQQKIDEYQGKQGNLATAFKALGDSIALLQKDLFGITPAAQAASDALEAAAAKAAASAGKITQALGGVASAVAAQLEEAKRKADDAAKAVGLAADALAKDVTAVQTAMTASLKSIDDTSKAAIAALGLQALTQQQLEDETVAITVKAAAERLRVLQESSAQIITAFNAEAAARLALVAGSVEKTKALETQLAGERKALLQQFVDAYQKQVNDLTAQETIYVQKIRTIDEQRIAINQNIEDRINAIRTGGLSAYAAYAQKVQQAEQLIQSAREQNAKGEFDKAKEYLDKALQLSDGLGKAVTENGQEIVSAQRAQITVEGLLTSARNTYNQALDGSKAKAEANKKATGEELQTAKTGLVDAGKELDRISTKYSDGLNVKIKADVTDAQTAVAIFDDAVESVDRILHIQLDLKAAQDSINTLKDNLKTGITAGAQDGVTDAIVLLKSIEKEENDPKIKFLTNDAAKQIDDLGLEIKHLEDIKVAPSVNVGTKGVPEAAKQLDDLSKDRVMNLEVRVKVTGDRIPGGGVTDAGVPAGDPGSSGFNRGGIVGAIQRFARGGSVFSGRKVPGSGNQDTYGANLQPGSFVVKKKAAAYYGDNLLGRLATGVQKFATGGLTFPLSFQNLLNTKLGEGIQIGLGGGGANPDLLDLEDKLQSIVTASVNMIPSHTLPDIHEWASALIDRVRSLPAAKLGPIKQAIDDNYQLMLDTINVARQFRVPAVVGPDLFAFLFGRGGGAPTTDTVPALLTPGEWVVNRGAVAKYGGGFMNAINNMRIPREALARLVEPPRIQRFADGGQVPAVSAGMTVPAIASRSTTNHISVNVTAGDILNEANIRRYFVPAWENIQRRSR